MAKTSLPVGIALLAEKRKARWQTVHSTLRDLLELYRPDLGAKEILEPLFNLGAALRAVNVFPGDDDRPEYHRGGYFQAPLMVAIRSSSPDTRIYLEESLAPVVIDGNGLEPFFNYIQQFVQKYTPADMSLDRKLKDERRPSRFRWNAILKKVFLVVPVGRENVKKGSSITAHQSLASWHPATLRKQLRALEKAGFLLKNKESQYWRETDRLPWEG